jgi:DNA-binding response OmpR family regulator
MDFEEAEMRPAVLPCARVSVKKRILIAEDEDAIRRLIRSLLQRQGFEVSEARNGVEAIDLIRSESFDLALVDLMMPIVSGYRVLELLRSEHPDVKTIVVTAAGDVGRGMLSPGTIVLGKPFDPTELVNTVSNLLATSEKRSGAQV